MCKLSRCVSKSSEMMIHAMDIIGTADLTEVQFESHYGVNYKVIELGMIFVTISNSVKQS